MNKEYCKFELRAIEAWRYDGMWESDASYKIESGLCFHESALTHRTICKALRDWGYLSANSAGRVRVYYDGDIYEILDKSTGEPLLALIPYE